VTLTSVGKPGPARKQLRPGQRGQLSLFPGRAAAGQGPESGARASSSPSFSPVSPAPRPVAAGVPRHYAKDVSAQGDQFVRRERRRKRDRLREVLNDVSSLKRCHNCGWAEARDPVGKDTGPQIASRDGVAYWRGVQTCGSIWACPVCGAKIRNGRSIEISEFAAEWIKRGNEVYMVTLTSPHDLGMALAALLVLIASAFRSVISGRPWTRLRDQVHLAGTIRALEVTHGENGWHPHLHVLVFVWGDVEVLAPLQLYFQQRWRKFIVRRGYRPPSALHGVKVEKCYRAEEAARYIVKTQDGRNPGNEVARSDMKTGRSGHRMPFEILADFEAAGGTKESMADLELWHEYETATFRHQAITWSPALRKLQREWLGAVEQSDDELAAAEVDGEAVADVSTSALRAITCIPGLRSALLDACEVGGLDGLSALAARHGFRVVSGRGVRVPRIVCARKVRAMLQSPICSRPRSGP
jgi:Replication protein